MGERRAEGREKRGSSEGDKEEKEVEENFMKKRLEGEREEERSEY